MRIAIIWLMALLCLVACKGNEDINENQTEFVIESDSLAISEDLLELEVEVATPVIEDSKEKLKIPKPELGNNKKQSNTSSLNKESEVSLSDPISMFEEMEIAGYATLDVPKRVEWGVPFEVIATIAKDRIRITEYSKKRVVKKYEIPITDKMEVSLYAIPSESIDIIPNNKDQQIIEERDVTAWTWECIPRKTGELELKLVISKITLDGNKETVLRDKVIVKSNLKNQVLHFLDNNWKWAWSGLIPIFLFFRKRKRIVDENS